MKIIKKTSFSTTENSYLIYEEKTKVAVLIDPGARFTSFEQEVEEKRLRVEQILLTHGHYDHVCAAPFYRDRYGAKVMISRAEKELLENPYWNVSLPLFGVRFQMKADDYFEEGDILTDLGLRVLASPGHTEGSVLFERDSMLFTGDTIFSGSVGRLDLPTGDEDAMKSTLRKVFSLDGDWEIYPGHGENTTLNQERRSNYYVREWLEENE